MARQPQKALWHAGFGVVAVALVLATLVGGVAGPLSQARASEQTPSSQQAQSSVELTAEEQAYCAENPTVSIAMDTSWLPYAYKDPASGEVRGVLVNLFNAVCDEVGLQPVYIAKDSYQQALAAAQSGETHLVSGIADDDAMAARNNLERTNPYINISYCAVTKGHQVDLFSADASYRIAVCVGSYSTVAMRERMPNYVFDEYASNEECMAAVESGRVDAALIASYAADYYRLGAVYSSLESTLIYDFNWGLCFGANTNIDPRLLSILNKGISTLTPNESTQAVYLGMTSATSDTWTPAAWLARHQVAVFCAVVLIGAAVFFTWAFYQRKRGRDLRKQRDTDGLTGLLNRSAFEREVERLLSEITTGADFIILDLDDFKSINDAYGHDAGDVVLRAVANGIRDTFCEGDQMARLGGDEFVIFVSMGASPEMTDERVNKLLEAIAAITVPEFPHIHVSACAGIAACPRDGASFVELYHHADIALYSAKHRGNKGGYARFSRPATS